MFVRIIFRYEYIKIQCSFFISFPIRYLETLDSVDAPIFAVKFLCMFNIRLGSMVYNDIAATDAPCMRLGIS